MSTPDKVKLPGDDGDEIEYSGKGLLIDIKGDQIEISKEEAYDLLAHLALMLRAYDANIRG